MAKRSPVKTGATYEDLCELPENLVAEIFDGELYATPRPALPHAHAASVLGFELGGPFHRGRNGPGGWWLFDEPELHFGANVLVPDLAGWRRSRLETLPVTPYFTLASGRWTFVAAHEGDALVRAEPFDAIELELGALWA